MTETRFSLERLDTRVGPVARVTITNDSRGSRPNTFGEVALHSLGESLARLRTRDWRGLVLTGDGGSFGAGADITEFPLHCDVRTISSTVRHVGFPEVFLGLIPAWGGTQLAPRLLGAEAAIRLVVENPLAQNRMIGAAEALALGLVDHVLEPDELPDESLELLLRRVEAGEGKRKLEADLSDAGDVVRRARSRVDDAVHGQAPAPYRALDLIEGASGLSLEDGYRAEEDAVAELLPGPEAQASIYAFDVVERQLERLAAIPHVEPRAIARVGIVGAGLMATQLATILIRRLEVPVVLTDVDPERAPGALEAIRGEHGRLAAKGRLAEDKAGSLAGMAVAGEGTDAYAGCGLVLEAVFEELGAKRDVFALLERVVSPECLLATNTSALSVTAMADGLAHPERVVGLHFFNPVAVLPLVEIVRTPSTDDVTLATAWDVVRRLRKRGVLVRDAPGFVVNRMLTRQFTVLMQALESGATFEETDEAALRLGLPMPPSALLAMVGPRVANHVLRTLNETWPDRFPLSPTLRALAEGELPQLEARDGRPSVDEIHERILEALADEARRILDEGVVSSAAEIDACLILGAGFPFFRGGITPYLDRTGISERVSGRTLAAA